MKTTVFLPASCNQRAHGPDVCDPICNQSGFSCSDLAPVSNPWLQSACARPADVCDPDRGCLQVATHNIRRIENTLSSGQHRAAGIDEAGDLIWIPPAAWRRPYPLGSREISPVEAGLLGRSIPVSGPRGLLACFPMISIRDLSLAFGADFVQIPAPPLNGLAYLFPQQPPPPPPRFVLAQIRELDEQPKSAMAITADADLEPLTASPNQSKISKEDAPPQKHIAIERPVGRPNAENTSIELFNNRRAIGEPLGKKQIQEAEAILRQWPPEGPPKPEARTISGHISCVWRDADKSRDKL